MKLSVGTDLEPVREYWGAVPVSERTGCKVLVTNGIFVRGKAGKENREVAF
jgi:hypothetical protein